MPRRKGEHSPTRALGRAVNAVCALSGRVHSGENPTPNQPIRPYSDFSSHNTWGTDHFGFLYQGDLTALCADLRKKGVSFPVELKKGVGGSLLCYVAAPDGVSIELMQC